ncbi:hypothetical protein N658DRAFT_354666 [Parathielavia hyrcaniae]|uniref:Zinc finger PHD-type domain-containing protein n=1 Tax=Parathielavia hyrcaniae TaxID=113614 RepID=A0AAN6Q718_9PEZI|nr:hypothetical protein N658DRAFT_354666 [Parathielavia hyrcaniae]
MAGADPRRSSRARANPSQSQLSSSASSVSGRPERNPRYFNKGASPQKSTSTGSLSSEPPEDTITAEDPFGTRRRTRGQAEERERAGSKAEEVNMASGDGDAQEEDEAVRCVCGNDEYQGPPPLDEDSKHGFKHAFGLDPFFSADPTDDTAGLFVQCDICKVWQHGGCVGIMTEDSSPDEYFCEQCRQDLHKLWTASNGVYSHYLPLRRNGRTGSRAASLQKDTVRSPNKEKETRNGRTSSASQTSKRRATLNSREAGYDETEALLRAIEASKQDAFPEPGESVSRRPKRGRSDSQEKADTTKRQKTSSRSASPSSDKNDEDSDEGDLAGRNGASKSKPRSALPTRNQRSEKPSEREERERQRAETANKRKGRADRRRPEDSDRSEEVPLATRTAASKTTQAAGTLTAVAVTAAEVFRPPAAAEPPPTSNSAPDAPPTITVQGKADKKRSHKKKGRNQYTRDRDANEDESPARSQSRDIQKDDHMPPGAGKPGGDSSGKTNPKSKGGMSSKITMNDMKRRAAALLDFISRTQVELAGESLPGSAAGTANGTGDSSAAGAENPPSEASGYASVPAPPTGDGDARLDKDFKELGCMEMMDTLTRRLVKWQQQYSTQERSG